MGGRHARGGAAQMGAASENAARILEAQRHHAQPHKTNVGEHGEVGGAGGYNRKMRELREEGMPPYMGNYDDAAIPYTIPSAQKERMALRSAIRQGAAQE